jgi:hypothetical protein
MARTCSSAPSMPSRARYPSATSALSAMAAVTSTVISTASPSTTTAWSIVVYGPRDWTSAHCHQASPNAVSEMIRVDGGGDAQAEGPLDQGRHAEEHHRTAEHDDHREDAQVPDARHVDDI